MIKKIDHLGIATADSEAALRIYRDALGLVLEETEEIPSQKLRSYHLRVGESHFELLEPTDPESTVARFLAKKGPGIHHVALAVADLPAMLAKLVAQGLEPLSPEPFIGAGGKQVIFFHPRTTGGVLLELCQPGEESV